MLVDHDVASHPIRNLVSMVGELLEDKNTRSTWKDVHRSEDRSGSRPTGGIERTKLGCLIQPYWDRKEAGAGIL
jgi:hypothetical protein